MGNQYFSIKHKEEKEYIALMFKDTLEEHYKKWKMGGMPYNEYYFQLLKSNLKQHAMWLIEDRKLPIGVTDIVWDIEYNDSTKHVKIDPVGYMVADDMVDVFQYYIHNFYSKEESYSYNGKLVKYEVKND